MTSPAFYLVVIGGLQLGLLWLLRERFGIWLPLAGTVVFAALIVALLRPRPHPGPPPEGEGKGPQGGGSSGWGMRMLALYVLVALTTAGPMAESMVTRLQVGLTIEHDGLIQTEAAVDRVLAGQRIYGVDWSNTVLGTLPWSTTSGPNPALHHFVYDPLPVLLGVPFRLVSRAAGLPFDYRVVLLLFLAIGVVAVRAFPLPAARRFMITVALFLNPLISTYLWTGRNDIAFVVMVLLSLTCLARGRVLFASLALGIALALKPFAVVAVPFLVLAIWRRRRGREIAGSIGLLAGPALITIVPFLLADPAAFWRDTVLYAGGGVADAYPIGGDGFGAFLLATGIIHRNSDQFPFWIFQVLAMAPVLWFSGRAFLRRPIAGRWMAGFAGVLLAFAFFARFFNDNYVAVILALFLTVPGFGDVPVAPSPALPRRGREWNPHPGPPPEGEGDMHAAGPSVAA